MYRFVPEIHLFEIPVLIQRDAAVEHDIGVAAAIKRVGGMKNKLFESYYGAKALDLDAIFEEYSVYAERLAKYVRDTSVMVYDAIKAGKKVLFEGAQGTLLDIDMGTYPYVTSSHPVSGGVCVGAGIGPTALSEISYLLKTKIRLSVR